MYVKYALCVIVCFSVFLYFVFFDVVQDTLIISIFSSWAVLSSSEFYVFVGMFLLLLLSCRVLCCFSPCYILRLCVLFGVCASRCLLCLFWIL